MLQEKSRGHGENLKIIFIEDNRLKNKIKVLHKLKQKTKGQEKIEQFFEL
jgi:hypothetical protein